MKIDFEKISAIPSGFMENCQVLLNNLAEYSQVPAALIMKLEKPFIEVFASSESEGNPYEIGDREYLPGLYCETVIKNKEQLLIPNALKDKDWDQNPDIKLGMISYLGFPLLFPNGNVFGTICILDSKERAFDENCLKLLLLMKSIFEENLKLTFSLEQKNNVLEMIATGKSLTETLNILIKNIEAQIKGVRCSILLLDKSGKYLNKGSGPSLPKSYCDALDGFEIGPQVGSCGAAAFNNETIIIEDIATDPKWEGFKDLALSHNLRACWSVPIRNTDGKVLGTLCPYFDEPREPTESELEMVLYSAHLSGIAIRLKQSEETSRESGKLARDSFNKILSILKGTSSETGKSFFRSLVYYLSSELGVRYAYFTKSAGPNRNKILALWMGKEFGDDFEYDTRGTPCEDNGSDELFCYFPEKVQDCFKTDHMLVEWEVESYLGVRLRDSSGKQVGSLVVMDDKPLLHGDYTKMILSALALRGQAELIRKERETELSLAKEAAEKGSNAKSEFLSRMSHELRTPMNAILGFSQLMQMDALNPLVDRQKEYLEHISFAGKHLLELINEVLELSNIESGNIILKMEPVNLFETLDKVISISQLLADENNITLSITKTANTDYYVEVDELRFKQVILNLISNAIKYNRPGGSVVVSYKKLDNDRLRIGIKDTGHGIADEKKNRIFLPFDRIDVDAEHIEGVGIGLTISKNLIEAMKGNIGFESVFGEGSYFYIDVQTSDKASGVIQSEDNSVANTLSLKANKKKKVLYIEDISSNVHLVERILENRPDIELISSSTALEGIEEAKTLDPDLILMDIKMPDMDGIEAYKKLQAIDETKNIPVVALSADAMDRDLKTALDLGFKSYITKPIDVLNFLNVIDSVLIK